MTAWEKPGRAGRSLGELGRTLGEPGRSLGGSGRLGGAWESWEEPGRAWEALGSLAWLNKRKPTIMENESGVSIRTTAISGSESG